MRDIVFTLEELNNRAERERQLRAQCALLKQAWEMKPAGAALSPSQPSIAAVSSTMRPRQLEPHSTEAEVTDLAASVLTPPFYVIPKDPAKGSPYHKARSTHSQKQPDHDKMPAQSQLPQTKRHKQASLKTPEITQEQSAAAKRKAASSLTEASMKAAAKRGGQAFAAGKDGQGFVVQKSSIRVNEARVGDGEHKFEKQASNFRLQEAAEAKAKGRTPGKRYL